MKHQQDLTRIIRELIYEVAILKAYLDYMVDVATLLGADPEFAFKEMRETLAFEIRLAEFALPQEERRNASKLYNPMRIRDLSELDPQTPWLQYINRILTTETVQVGNAQAFRNFKNSSQNS